jgi:predicted nucleic acid-binding protein
MIRALFDTNLLVSAFLTRHHAPEALLSLVRGNAV